MKSHLKNISTLEKALELNLQPSIYGAFAEIGAGQEVANQFFKAGAASGTIAKTISTYDMTVSDSVYGETNKYVSKSRVESMLEVEYKKLVEGLSARTAQTHFFVLADSIETINYHKTNQGQGWMGIKFQQTPNGPTSTCIIHLLFHTNDINEQRKIVGDLGVNLIYGAFEYIHEPELFINSLRQNINPDYLEINFIECSGNKFSTTDSLAMSLQLVKSGLTKMIMIGKEGEILQPSNALYKKDVVLIRGRFRPPTKVTEEMFNRSREQLVRNELAQDHTILPVAEITFTCFQEQSELSLSDFIHRSRLIGALGYPVMVTNFTRHHELIEFMNSIFRLNSLNIVLGLDNLRKVTSNEQKAGLEKRILELALSISSSNNRILAFPELNSQGELTGLESLKLKPTINHLFSFLKSMDRILEVENVNPELLSIRSDKVHHALKNNIEEGWRDAIPERLILALNGS